MKQTALRKSALLLICTQIACTSTPGTHRNIAQDAIRFDSNLIQPYSLELEQTKPFASPFVAHFQHNQKELHFLASRHISVRESPDLRDHPTLKTIAKIFAERKPRIVVIGGVPSGDELSPEWYVKYARSCETKNYVGCGESAYAAFLADQNKVQFINGDPSDFEIKLGLKERGFSDQDVLGFYVARQLQQHFREDRNFSASEAGVKSAIESDLRDLRKQLKSDFRFEYRDFTDWLKQRSRTPMRGLLSQQAFAPLSDGTLIQKISYQVDILRNQSLLKRLESMMNLYGNVLVVYGSAHYLSLNPALEAALGKPAVEKPY